DEYFNTIKDDPNFNKSLKKLKQLLKDTNLFDLDDKSYINESILSWINNTFNVFSELKSSSNNSDSLKEQKGLFLLEHFRCPVQIFNSINYSFYDEILEYSQNISQCDCSFSEHSELLCTETSFIQLKYEFKDDMYKNNCNLEEIKIALNFIVDNLKYFLKHNNMSIDNMNEEALIYLSKNILLVSFYKDQKDKINSILNDITSYLEKYLANSKNELYIEYQNTEKNISYFIFNKIKSKYNNQQITWINKFLKKLNCGTIDSTQGLGVDFVIMSNVSKTIFHEEKHYFRKFENDSKRINVFWTRTKKHFIQIISNNYWDDFNKINLDKIDENSKKGVESRRLVEVLINDNTNKIVFDINWKRLNNDLSIQNLWNTYKYKGD
ncbi:MAG: hypothetical protein K2L64_01730, partial [Ureaplasma sp.]|nr:hypothetical protein [Ureaplasma sp.]